MYSRTPSQVARNDSTAPGATPLADYYDEKGEAPGVWVGSGLVGLDGLAEGDTVTAEQMTFLFGQGEHPLAAERVAAIGPHATEEELREAVLLGVPFRQPDTNTNLFRSELSRRYQIWNQEQGNRREAKIPDHVRAGLRTQLAVEWFTAIEHRAPNPRELTGFIARMSRPPATPVAGWDLTFSPVKSVSALWALADRPTAALIEAAHQAAVRDALRYIEAHVLKTRKGHAGVEQVDVTGLVAAAFTHRDTRAGDPDLHTHVAVANKVQAVVDGQWRAIDGRVMHTAITSASETYNTALEAHLTAALGVRFVDVPRTDGRRPVREIDGVDQRLIRLWSTRRKRSRTVPVNWPCPSSSTMAGRRRRPNGRSCTKSPPSKHARPSTNPGRATSSARSGRNRQSQLLARTASTPCCAMFWTTPLRLPQSSTPTGSSARPPR